MSAPLRRAKLHISMQLLLQVLHLPEGTTVDHAEYNKDRDVLVLSIIEESLPEIQPDIESPVVYAKLRSQPSVVFEGWV